MTAQLPERIILDGRPFRLHSTPLESLLADRDMLDFVNDLVGGSSACWRGYRGTWEIIGKRLHLIHLNIPNQSDDDDEPWCPELPFPPEARKMLLRAIPADDLPVAADWFSGTLVVEIGRLLAYRHSLSGHTFERERHITVADGIVVEDREVDNTGAGFRREFERDPMIRADEAADGKIEDEWPPDYVRLARTPAP